MYWLVKYVAGIVTKQSLLLVEPTPQTIQKGNVKLLTATHHWHKRVRSPYRSSCKTGIRQRSTKSVYVPFVRCWQDLVVPDILWNKLIFKVLQERCLISIVSCRQWIVVNTSQKYGILHDRTLFNPQLAVNPVVKIKLLKTFFFSESYAKVNFRLCRS